MLTTLNFNAALDASSPRVRRNAHGNPMFSPREVAEILERANLAWVLPRWAEAYNLYKSIENVDFGHVNGHVAYRLGLLTRRGYGENGTVAAPPEGNSVVGEKYFKIAKELVAKGAEEEDCEALCDLGHMYENGNAGVAIDLKQAIRYYKLAAEKGHPRGQYNLAVMLQQEGAKASALEYYKLAARAEYPCAQYNLACMYHRESDFKAAIHFFARAATWGDGDAHTQLTKLFSDTTSPVLSVQRTQFLVEEWREYYQRLHISCRIGLKDVILVMRSISLVDHQTVLPELVEIILDFVIQFWPSEDKHFQQLPSIQ